MDFPGRRSRRRARSNFPLLNHNFTPCGKPKGIINSLCNIFILASLIGIIYLMLEYHCSTCSAKYNLNSITQNIDDIAKNLTFIKNSYYELETKISQLSQDLPKIEGQIEILEALALTTNNKDFLWDSKKLFNLPYVDDYANQHKQVKINVTQTLLPT